MRKEEGRNKLEILVIYQASENPKQKLKCCCLIEILLTIFKNHVSTRHTRLGYVNAHDQIII